MTNIIELSYLDSFIAGTDGVDTLVVDFAYDEMEIETIITNPDFLSFTFFAWVPNYYGDLRWDFFQVANVEYFQFTDQTLTFEEIVQNYTDFIEASTGTDGADVYTGTDGDDVFRSYGGDDILSGGEGDDELYAAEGNDIIEGGAGDDYVWGGDGIDTVVINDTFENSVLMPEDGATPGAQGIYNIGDRIVIQTADGTDTYHDVEYFEFSDQTVSVSTLVGSTEHYLETILGTSGDDVIYGLDRTTTDQTQLIAAGDGNDTFYLGSLGVHFNGGDGIDTVVLGVSSDAHFEFTGVSSGGINLHFQPVFDYDAPFFTGYFVDVEFFEFTDVTLTLAEVYDLQGGRHSRLTDPNGEEFIGLDGIDFVYGSDGDDRILGRGGNDDIDGWSGDDTILGGAGNDYLKGGDGDDIIGGSLGRDLVNGGHGNDQITGGAGNDRLLGQLGDDTIHGGNGRDELEGGDGDDRAYGGRGADALYGDGGDDSLYGGRGADQLAGGLGDDRLIGGAGDDALSGYDGRDVLKGGNGSDTLNGDDGGDLISGGNGADIIDGGNGNDVLNGGAGHDLIDGGFGNDTIIGGSGDDQIWSSSGSDVIRGGNGLDIISAGWGGDIVDGGAGADQISLGNDSDKDTVVITNASDSRAGGNRDLVWQFDVSRDEFDFSGIDADENQSGHQDLDYSTLNTGPVSNGVWVLYNDLGNALISGDVNGDGVADFEVLVYHISIAITADNFVV